MILLTLDCDFMLGLSCGKGGNRHKSIANLSTIP